METLQVGRAKLTWLNGGVNYLDGGAMFGVVPKALWSRKYPHDDKNRVELRTDSILLQMDGKNFLIDSGIGNGKLTDKQMRNFGVYEESSIEKSLSELDLGTEDIDAMLMTHLHFDHACGLTEKAEDEFIPVFENAAIHVSQTEWDEMRNPNIRSINTYWKENWEPVQEQVQPFEHEKEIARGFRMIHTGGHSDGHAILVFEEENACFIHMADIMPTHAHQNKLWALAYDDYPVTSVHEKEKWMDFGYKRQAWYTFYHDAYLRAIKFDRDGTKMDEVERKRYSYNNDSSD